MLWLTSLILYPTIVLILFFFLLQFNASYYVILCSVVVLIILENPLFQKVHYSYAKLDNAKIASFLRGLQCR